MALSNSQYQKIRRDYEKRQLQNRHLLEQRIEEVYVAIPAYKDLEDSISSVSVSQGKKLLDGDGNALSELKHLIHELSEQKKALLVQAGFPDDYLEPIYHCNDCQDTGYSNGQKCHCFKQAMISMLYEQSNIQEMLKKENFSSLSEHFYQGEDLIHFRRAVANCRKFIENFNSSYQNLFFYGTVGTGKSFLSGCVAKDLIEKGQAIIYFSASQLFESLSVNPYDFKNKEDLYNLYEDIYNCDLLIIDDLGTETTRANVSSLFFSCLNERHLREKSTLISTNLSLEELRSRYSDRIFSRITSNYELCKLSGPDIRMYKKINNN